MAKEDKIKALEAAISNIERSYGKGAIMKLGDPSASLNVETIPTGSISLDVALGMGGVPKGRIIEIYGPESSGKTTVALHMVAEVQKLTDKKLVVDIKEVKRPDKDAQLVAENIALQLENRVSFRRAMKSCMGRAMKAGVKGIKTTCSGRLGGADMARTETYNDGTTPLQTIRADIDYGFAEADTTYGKVGVKVWIYKGEVLPTKANKEGGAK